MRMHREAQGLLREFSHERERAMERKSERLKLADRFREKAAAGLRDVKFYVRNPTEAIAETVCKEVNALYDAVAGGKCASLDLGDSKR
jgi:hypothetical protein